MIVRLAELVYSESQYVPYIEVPPSPYNFSCRHESGIMRGIPLMVPSTSLGARSQPSDLVLIRRGRLACTVVYDFTGSASPLPLLAAPQTPNRVRSTRSAHSTRPMEGLMVSQIRGPVASWRGSLHLPGDYPKISIPCTAGKPLQPSLAADGVGQRVETERKGRLLNIRS
jgi:hypothetical protein